MKNVHFIFIIVFIIIACQQKKRHVNKEYHSHKIDTLISSSNVDTLGQIINLTEFKPYKVKFIYFPESVCGLEGEIHPSWNLEAVMFFDNNAIKKINKFLSFKDDTTKANLNTYFFEWLKHDELKAFSRAKTQFLKPIYQNNNEPFSKSNCDYIVIGNAIFLKHTSNN